MWSKIQKRPEKEPDFVSSSDHEDFENEYYARRSSGGIIGFVFLVGAIVLIGCYALLNAFLS
jgi:hypothetical protein